MNASSIRRSNPGASCCRTPAALTDPHGTHTSTRRRPDIPVLGHALRYLPGHPDDGYAWHMAMEEADTATIGRVAGLAAAVLPLDGIASGPAPDLGLGPGYRYGHVRETVLPALAGTRGRARNWCAALASRVVRVRRAALRVLRQWPATYRGWVAAAATAEPDAKLRAEMDTYVDSILAGDESMA